MRTHNPRRRLLKSLAGGGLLASCKLVPEQWSRPMVESVTLPAHAALSTCNDTYISDFSIASCADGCCITITIEGQQVDLVIRCYPDQNYPGQGTLDENGEFDITLNGQSERVVGRLSPDCSQISGTLRDGECSDGENDFVARPGESCTPEETMN